MKEKMTISLGGVPLEFISRFDTIHRRLASFLTQEPPVATIAVSDKEMEAARAVYPNSHEDYWEFIAMCPRTCDALLPYNRCLFHGLSFLWQGKAWLFTAPSGTGKTTQYAMWKIQFDSEVKMMNGDKPLLDFSGDEIWVHPSPWMGKEGMQRMISAPLGGIIYLRQGDHNSIRPLPIREAVRPLYCQFLYSAGSEEQARQVCRLEEKLLTKVPLWELTNLGDKESARLTHDTLLHYLEQEAAK